MALWWLLMIPAANRPIIKGVGYVVEGAVKTVKNLQLSKSQNEKQGLYNDQEILRPAIKREPWDLRDNPTSFGSLTSKYCSQYNPSPEEVVVMYEQLLVRCKKLSSLTYMSSNNVDFVRIQTESKLIGFFHGNTKWPAPSTSMLYEEDLKDLHYLMKFEKNFLMYMMNSEQETFSRYNSNFERRQVIAFLHETLFAVSAD